MESSLVSCLPATCETYEVIDAVQQARRVTGSGKIIVVSFHPFNFTSWGMTILDFEHLLRWLAEQKDISGATLGQTVREIPSLDWRTFAANENCIAATYLMPPFMKERIMAEHCYLTKNLADRIALRSLPWLLFLYGVVLVVPLAVAFWSVLAIPAKSRIMLSLLKIVGPVALLLLGYYTATQGKFDYEESIILVALFGSAVGAAAAAFRRLKKKHPSLQDKLRSCRSVH